MFAGRCGHNLPMATFTQVVAAYATAFGLPPRRVENYARILQGADLVPTSAAGANGKAAKLFYDTHLANIIMSTAGDAKDGPDSVRILSELQRVGGSERFDDWLTDQIRKAATPDGAAFLRAKIDVELTTGLQPQCINLCVEPAHTSVEEWENAGRSRTAYSFLPIDRNSWFKSAGCFRRVTTIGMDAVLVAGALYAHTLASNTLTSKTKAAKASNFDGPLSDDSDNSNSARALTP